MRSLKDIAEQLLGPWIGTPIQRGIERQQKQIAVRQSHVDSARCLKAAQKESGADEQDSTNCDLPHNQSVAKPESCDGGSTVGVGFQVGHQVWSRRT